MRLQIALSSYIHLISINFQLYRSQAGVVYVGSHKFDHKKYVLKERKVSELGRRKDIMHEVGLLNQLNSPNVVKCEGFFADEQRQSIFIVLEYCPGDFRFTVDSESSSFLCRLIVESIRKSAA